jgi:predicted nucleic acid-binding protein
MMVVDASVWVSHFMPQEVNHMVSRRWLTQQINKQSSLIVPTILLPEVSGAIGRRTNDPKLAYLAVRQILATPNLVLSTLTPEISELAAELAADLRLRGADAVYVATAQQHQSPLVSWDVEQLERTASILNTFNPFL